MCTLIESQLWPMTMRYVCRIYLNKTITHIISIKLSSAVSLHDKLRKKRMQKQQCNCKWNLYIFFASMPELCLVILIY